MVQSSLKNILQKLQRFFEENPLGFPLVLLGLALVTYGVFIASLGFYWDDWPPLVFTHMADKSAVWQYFTYDRPFQSWTYYLQLPICRDSAFCWQLSVILFRWTAALALYFTFLKLFPGQKRLLQWVSALFLVYPGFSAQYASVAFGSHFLDYTVFGLSLLTMVLALKDRKRFWIFYPLSLVLTAVSLFTMEYFVGLEALRPVLIFLALSGTGEKKGKILARTLIFWSGFLIVFGIYLYWRMVLYPATMGGGTGDNYPYIFQSLLKAPGDTLSALLTTIYTDLRFVLLSAWTDRLLPVEIDLQRLTHWLALFIGLAAALIVAVLVSRNGKTENDSKAETSPAAHLLLGAYIVIVSLVPIWSTLRLATVGKWSDRFAIPAMWGAALIAATMILAFIQPRKIQQILLVVLVGLSAAFQIRTGNEYRLDFERQQRFYSQLKWRIPSLQPDTFLYAPTMPATREADYSFTAGINLLYSGDQINPSFDYWFSGPRYYDVNDLLKDPSAELTASLRSFHASAKASDMVGVYMPATGCLWVVDPYYSQISEGIDDFTAYGKLTNQDRILEADNGVNGLSNIFDFASHDSWCYYFEKGDLAQSKGKWQEAISYYEQAMQNKLVPSEGIEYLPFVKAFVMNGDLDQGISLSQAALDKSYLVKPPLCALWHDLAESDSKISLTFISPVYNADLCPAYFSKVQP